MITSYTPALSLGCRLFHSVAVSQAVWKAKGASSFCGTFPWNLSGAIPVHNMGGAPDNVMPDSGA